MPAFQFPFGPDDLDPRKTMGPHPLPEAERQAQANPQHTTYPSAHTCPYLL